MEKKRKRKKCSQCQVAMVQDKTHWGRENRKIINSRVTVPWLSLLPYGLFPCRPFCSLLFTWILCRLRHIEALTHILNVFRQHQWYISAHLLPPNGLRYLRIHYVTFILPCSPAPLSALEFYSGDNCSECVLSPAAALSSAVCIIEMCLCVWLIGWIHFTRTAFH